MFYVSISKNALDRIMGSAKSTDKEVIGILVGNIENHTIVIEDAVSGDQISEGARASLPPKTIAEVADKILKGEVKGRIMGWYHSHPGFGLFMSSTDINTQKNLQQFSAKVTAMIVDPDKEEFAFFTLHDGDDIVRLEKEQVHVFEEGEETIPEHFSSPPKIPKKEEKPRIKPSAPFLLTPESNGVNKKLIAIAVVVVLIAAVIGGMLILKRVRKNPKISSIDTISLYGDSEKNQLNTTIFRDLMDVHAKVTIAEGRITDEGLRFYLGLDGQGWEFLGNVTLHTNRTFILRFDTKAHDEGVHRIKVNFTDTFNNTWEKMSELFIIDNIPDNPEAKFLEPREGDIIDGSVMLYAEVKDMENNIYSVGFYHLNNSGNWSLINETEYDRFVYVTTFDTNQLSNGTYQIKVEAEDRNLYIGEDIITVIVSHGG